MADYKHLTVSAGSNSTAEPASSLSVALGSKSLVRNNSVATLNQIYQHQNSIPARNRILNTAKSLQHPSFDVPELHMAAGAPIDSEQILKDTSVHQGASSEAGAESSKQPFLLSWSTRLGATVGQKGAGNSQPAKDAAGKLVPASQTPSMPIKIINVARRHRRNQRQSDSSDYNNSWASSANGQLAHRQRESSPSLLPGNPPRLSTSGRGYSSSTSGSGSSGSSREASPAERRVSGARVGAAPVQGSRSPSVSRSPLLGQAPVGGPSSTSGCLSRSPSPSRSPSRQQLPGAQLSAGSSPTHHLHQHRRRMLPAEPSSAPAIQQRYQQQQQQVISKPGDDTDRTSPKRHRKLPQIPALFAGQPLAQPQQVAGCDKRAAQAGLFKRPPPPIVARSNKSSLSSSSSSSSNSPSVTAGQRSPAPSFRPAGRLSQQLSGGDLRVQSFPMPASATNVLEPAGSGLAPEPAVSKSKPQHLAVIYKQAQQLGSSGSGSINTESFHSSSPRSPMLAANYQAGQQFAGLARGKLATSPNSPQNVSPASSLLNGRYFTFEQAAGQLEQPLQQQSLEPAASLVNCYSPGGSRRFLSGNSAEESISQASSNQQQPPMGVNSCSQLLGFDSSSCSSSSAGRGRRLSSCGSGLRANFLMNKQHAISEFTPPRSLESSTSRGSNDWTHVQPASESCLHSASGALNRPASPAPIKPNCRPLPAHNSAEMVRTNPPSLLEASSGGPEPHFRSCSAQNIIARNNSFGQQQQVVGCGALGRQPATAAKIQPEGQSRSKQLAASQRVRSHMAAGLPPRAASATETSSSNREHASGDGLLSFPSSSFQARSMIAVQSGALSSSNVAAGSLLARGPQQPHQQQQVAAQRQNTLAPSQPGELPTGWGKSLVQLRPRLASNANLPGAVSSAVSIDVYHCDQTGSGRSSFDGPASAAPQTAVLGVGGGLDPAASWINTGSLSRAGESSARSSQVQLQLMCPTQERDRQPSNVSTNSMPAAFTTGSVCWPGHSSVQLAATASSQQQAGPRVPGETGAGEEGRAQEAGSAPSTGAGGQRKFGAWVEILGAGAAGKARESRWQRSASQLAGGQSSSISKSFSLLSSSATSSSRSLGRGNLRDDEGEGDTSHSASSSSSSSCNCDKRRLRSPHGNGLAKPAGRQRPRTDSQHHLSSGGDSSSGSWLSSLSSSSRRRLQAGSKKRSKHQRHRRRQATASSRAPAAEIGTTRQEEPEAAKAGNYSDQLTIGDRLKLAQRSASKLFPKVDLSASGAGGGSAGARSANGPQRKSPLAPASELARGQSVADWRLPVAGPGRPIGGCLPSGERPGAGRADEENGDDLSLFLRSAERELEHQRRSELSFRSAPEEAGGEPSAKLKRNWLLSLGKRQRADSSGQLQQPQSQHEESPTGGSALRKGSSRAAKVVRRAMTIRSLVRNLASGQQGSSSRDEPEPPSSPRIHLLSSTSGGRRVAARRSVDESTSRAQQCASSSRPLSASELPSAGRASLGARTATKLRATVLFRRPKTPNSAGSSRELHDALSKRHSKPASHNHTSKDSPPTSQKQPPAGPSRELPAPAAPEREPSVAPGTAADSNQEQPAIRAHRSLSKMKSVITAVSKTLEPLKAMSHLRHQHSMYTADGQKRASRAGSLACQEGGQEPRGSNDHFRFGNQCSPSLPGPNKTKDPDGS